MGGAAARLLRRLGRQLRGDGGEREERAQLHRPQLLRQPFERRLCRARRDRAAERVSERLDWHEEGKRRGAKVAEEEPVELVSRWRPLVEDSNAR